MSRVVARKRHSKDDDDDNDDDDDYYVDEDYGDNGNDEDDEDKDYDDKDSEDDKRRPTLSLVPAPIAQVDASNFLPDPLLPLIRNEEGLLAATEGAIKDCDLDGAFQLLRLHAETKLTPKTFVKVIGYLLLVPSKRTERAQSITATWMVKIIILLFSLKAFGKRVVTKNLFKLCLHASYANSELSLLLVNAIAPMNLSPAMIRKATVGICLDYRHLRFLDQWFSRTRYILSFDLQFPRHFAAVRPMLSLLGRVLDSDRLPRQEQDIPTWRWRFHPQLRDLSIEALVTDAEWTDDRIERLVSTCRPFVFERDDRSRPSGVRSPAERRVWLRVQHKRYYNYALALAPLNLPIYVSVAIIDFIVTNRDVKEIEGVRIVQSLYNARVKSATAASARNVCRCE